MNCAKVGYATYGAAKNALRACQRKGGKHKEQRVYFCDECRRYHLTKEPSDENRVRRRLELALYDDGP